MPLLPASEASMGGTFDGGLAGTGCYGWVGQSPEMCSRLPRFRIAGPVMPGP